MAKPILDVTYYTEPFCEYPTIVKHLMDDGTVQTYVLQNKVDYQFKAIYDGLSKLRACAEGYQYKPGKHEKKPSHKGKL